MNITDESLILGILEETSRKSTCLKRQVSCLIYDEDETLIGHGTNRCSDSGWNCKKQDSCLSKDGHCVATTHAEIAALVDAKNQYPNASGKGGTVIINHRPCKDCYNAILSAGYKKILILTD